jgi:hypothetical protein
VKAVAAWTKIKGSTSNLFRRIKETKQTVEDIDEAAMEIAISMKLSLDRLELLEIAESLESKAKAIRKLAKTL